jgi:hypothetical protein
MNVKIYIYYRDPVKTLLFEEAIEGLGPAKFLLN